MYFKLLIITSLFVFISKDGFTQRGWVTVKHGIIKKLPMKNAVVTSNEYRGFEIIDYFPSLDIRSICDSVFSNTDGIVQGIYSSQENSVVMIKVTDSLCYVFSGFKKIDCVEHHVIRKGDFIGLASKKRGKTQFEISLKIVGSWMSFFDEKQIWAIIKRD